MASIVCLSAVVTVVVGWCSARAEPLFKYFSTFTGKKPEFKPFLALVIVHKVNLAQAESQVVISALARKGGGAWSASWKGFEQPGSKEIEYGEKLAVANGGLATSGQVPPANANAKLLVLVTPATPRIQVWVSAGWLNSFVGSVNIDAVEQLNGREGLDKTRFNLMDTKGKRTGAVAKVRCRQCC